MLRKERSDRTLPDEHSEAAHRRFWRSLPEADDSAASVAGGGGPRHNDHVVPTPTGRRAFLKIMGASVALAGAGCTRPPLQRIVPYRDGPPQATYGKPVFYATTLPHDGYGLPVLVETNMGR